MGPENSDSTISSVESFNEENITNSRQVKADSKNPKKTKKEWVTHILLGPDFQGARQRVLLQGIFGAMILFGIFTSLHFIPAAEATAIFFMIPIFSFSFSACILKERFTFIRVLISFISLSGVLLVVRPKIVFGEQEAFPDKFNHDLFLHPLNEHETISVHDSITYHVPVNESSPLQDTEISDALEWKDHIIGYISALLVPISVSLCTIVTRQLAMTSPQTLDIPLLMAWQGIGSVLIGLVSYTAFNVEVTDGFFNLLSMSEIIAITIFGMMGNIFLALSTKFISPSLMNVIRCIEVVFMFIIQMELSDSKEHKVFHVEHGFGIFALFLTALLICNESDIRSRFKFL